MKILKTNIYIILASIILGILLAIQLKATSRTSITNIPYDKKNQQLILDIRKIQKEKTTLEKRLNKLNDIANKYEKQKASESKDINKLLNEVETYKMLSGCKDVYGPGIIIEINDLNNDFDYFDTNELYAKKLKLLLNLINNLKSVNAEAISINELRYTNRTEIVLAGLHIEINGVSVNTPLTIKAIGNPDLLEEVINFTIYTSDFDIQLKKQQDIFIPKYKKVLDFKYAKPIKQ
ncbi:DUF881 domain-containing protein [Caloranaerobacter ferrireducens]|uniref:DUF881 domain-containing protein n=1 Tax=Caloranaerobacter ferrireducens TaxID=1323370 RepID=UPI00084DADF7|nr:DUF881 domain-containing protein [Caloranaerobacter ferrireducens]